MKTINNFKLVFAFLIVGLTFSSCVQDDDFDVPEITFEEPDVEVTTTIQAVKDLYLTSGSQTPVLIDGENLVLEGYVISNDKAGNFYKELIIQDKPENPTAGIVIATNTTDLYTFFEPGRKVYVKLDGLYVGDGGGGLITLGQLFINDGEEQVGRMDNDTFANQVLRSVETVDIVPTVLTLNEVSDSKLNTLVKFESMKFADSELGNAYANLDNTFSENRVLEDCETGQTVELRTSGFANFKNQLLPEGSGSITCVLSKFNADYQVYIRNTDDVIFDQPRCEEDDDPDPGIVVELPFAQDFEGLANTGNGVNIDLDGWTNVNVNGGLEKYEGREFDNNKYAQISAFNTGENPLEVWLVTPGLDLTSTPGNVTLTFDTKDGFNNGEGLKVYASTDFSGDVTTATWTELSATIATGTTNGYADQFTASGDVDLSSFNGDVVYIGFEYVGGDGGITTTYQVDNLSVVEN